MGRPVRLSDEMRKGVVLLMFYPADFDMICSIQMGEPRDLYQEFETLKIQILPIPTNSVRSYAAWKESMRLPFLLLVDEDGRVTRSYDMACDDDAELKNRSCRGLDHRPGPDGAASLDTLLPTPTWGWTSLPAQKGTLYRSGPATSFSMCRRPESR